MINFPIPFVIKCNHGCKWQYIIKNKEEFLKNKRLFDIVKRNITGWLGQDYSFWGGFEMQYRNIKPKILFEPLMRDEIDKPCEEIEVYCFNGKPTTIFRLYANQCQTIYNSDLLFIEDIYSSTEKIILKQADELIKKSLVLSEQLSKVFPFVRVDFMICQNRIYFEELTFTPYSGFHKFKNKKVNIDYGNLLNLEDYKYE